MDFHINYEISYLSKMLSIMTVAFPNCYSFMTTLLQVCEE